MANLSGRGGRLNELTLREREIAGQQRAFETRNGFDAVRLPEKPPTDAQQCAIDWLALQRQREALDTLHVCRHWRVDILMRRGTVRTLWADGTRAEVEVLMRRMFKNPFVLTIVPESGLYRFNNGSSPHV